MANGYSSLAEQNWGWEPSDLASKEERDAYRARQVRTGRLPSSELPEAYGGRPTGTSRRAIRARAAWLEQQKFADEQEKAQMARDKEFREFQSWKMSMASSALDIENKTLKRDQDRMEELERNRQSNAILKGLMTIDVQNDPDASLKLEELAGDYPLGSLDEGTKVILDKKKIVADTYGIKARQQKRDESNALVSEEVKKFYAAGGSEQALAAAKEANTTTGEVVFNPNKIREMTGLLEGQRVISEREKEKAAPQLKREGAIESEKRSMRGDLRTSITSLEDDVAKAESDLETSRPNSADRAKIQSKIDKLKKQIELRKKQYDELGGYDILDQGGSAQTTGQRPALGDIFGGQ